MLRIVCCGSEPVIPGWPFKASADVEDSEVGPSLGTGTGRELRIRIPEKGGRYVTNTYSECSQMD
jgi:hypothetical protein